MSHQGAPRYTAPVTENNLGRCSDKAFFQGLPAKGSLSLEWLWLVWSQFGRKGDVPMVCPLSVFDVRVVFVCLPKKSFIFRNCQSPRIIYSSMILGGHFIKQFLLRQSSQGRPKLIDYQQLRRSPIKREDPSTPLRKGPGPVQCPQCPVRERTRL